MNQDRALIMVVDDEEQIASLASLFLRRAGYRTLTATTIDQALEVWNAEVDLLLTDCVMPEMSGAELAARLLEQKPSLKTIFMSGNVAEAIESGIPLNVTSNFIQKPFLPDILVGLVGRMIGPTPPARGAGSS